MPTFLAHLPVLHAQQEIIIVGSGKRNVIRAGRRSGKTTGIADLACERFLYEKKRILYATPTQEQVDQFWYTVKDILREPLAANVYYKNESTHIIEVPDTKQRIRAKTAWNADTLRGDYADVLILDEAQLMQEDALELVGLPMLADNDGDLYVIYTPPSIESMARSKARNPQYVGKLFKKAQADKTGRWKTFHFTSFDNPYISQVAVEKLAEDMSSVAYRMEILAEDVDESVGSLWTRKTIEDNRMVKTPEDGLARIVIGVDPSETSTGDECGIIAAGTDTHSEYYVMEDASLQGSPLTWATEVVRQYYKHRADKVVAESNAGGEMVRTVIHQVDPDVPVQLVHASRGKQTRAAPVATLAEKKRLHHVGNFARLEDELCLWIPTSGRSPNRLDAMVWAITNLMQSGKLKAATSRQG
jgi:hypothetical protein